MPSARNDPGDYHRILKLLMLGDSLVGKTSLVRRVCDGVFQASEAIPTYGMDFRTKIVTRNGLRLRLQIWDTAGQERFQTITPQYYRDAMGIVLAYDITNERSFKNVSRWIKDISANTERGKIEMILVGTKVDLTDSRQVSLEESKALADSLSIAHFEVSSLTGERVREAFAHIADLIIENTFSVANSLSGERHDSFLLTPENDSQRSNMKKSCCASRVV